MKIILSLVICLFIFVSCEKENEPEMLPEKIVYEFQSLDYFLGEADGIKIDSFKLDSQRFLNNSSGILSVNIENFQPTETSEFSILDAVPFELVNLDSTIIGVPIHINEKEIMLGDYKWQYIANHVEELPYAESKTYTIVNLPAHTKYSVDIYARRVNISTHYTATYIEQRTGRSLKVTGKWKGQQINGTTSIAKLETL